MLTKKEFTQKYSECVCSLQNIKSSNDHINKSFDRLSYREIALLMYQQQERVRQKLLKVEKSIQQMTKSYLDPDSIRRINTLREQLFIQIKRRRQFDNKINLLKEQQEKQRRRALTKQNLNTKGKDDNKENMNQKYYEDMQNKYEREHIQLRSKQIAEAEAKLKNINKIVKQTGIIVEKGGQKIGIIEQNMEKGQIRVQLANKELKQANIKSKRKWLKYKIIGIILVGVGVFLTIILVL